jgi:hypothetical protein
MNEKIQHFELQRDPKVTSLVARSSRGRCAQHLHDTRPHDARRTQILRDIGLCARFTPDACHIRESDANVACTCGNKGCYFWILLYVGSVVLALLKFPERYC